MWSLKAARETIQGMGLDPADWEPRFYFDGATGQRYDTIVMVTPPVGWQNCHHDWIETRLKTATDNLILL
jgi:hypothetical protein